MQEVGPPILECSITFSRVLVQFISMSTLSSANACVNKAWVGILLFDLRRREGTENAGVKQIPSRGARLQQKGRSVTSHGVPSAKRVQSGISRMSSTMQDLLNKHRNIHIKHAYMPGKALPATSSTHAMSHDTTRAHARAMSVPQPSTLVAYLLPDDQENQIASTGEGGQLPDQNLYVGDAGVESFAQKSPNATCVLPQVSKAQTHGNAVSRDLGMPLEHWTNLSETRLRDHDLANLSQNFDGIEHERDHSDTVACTPSHDSMHVGAHNPWVHDQDAGYSHVPAICPSPQTTGKILLADHMTLNRQKDIHEWVSMSISTAVSECSQSTKKNANSKAKVPSNNPQKKGAKDSGSKSAKQVEEEAQLQLATAAINTSAAALLLDIADRVPYIAVKQKDQKIWDEFRITCSRAKDDVSVVRESISPYTCFSRKQIAQFVFAV
jgi:hypothetical protein